MTEQTSPPINKEAGEAEAKNKGAGNGNDNGNDTLVNESGSSLLRRSLGKLFSPLRLSNLHNRSWQTKVSLLLAVAAIISGFATYAALNEAPPFGNNPDVVIWLLNIDLVILLLLVALIARRIVLLWANRRKGLAGSRLHVRLVYIFSILAAVPTIIMTVFSAFFFYFGVQAWFSQHVQTAINESRAVAESYLEEHKQVIKADTLAMASDLDRQSELLLINPKAFSKVMETQSMLRNLPEAIVFNKKGRIIAKSDLTLTLGFEKVPKYALEQADMGEVVLTTSKDKDRVRALVALNNFDGYYLFVGRMIDSRVLAHLSSTSAAVQDYAELQASYAGLQITVTMLFVVIGLLMLLAAIWFSLMLARELVGPISELIDAADRVRSGDLDARVPVKSNIEEFEFLARSFNRMTEQIQQQRDELVQANRQIDQRRRLTETVLKGVSSGVIGIDKNGVINLANASAIELLGLDERKITGQHILEILPEIEELLKKAEKAPRKITPQEIQVSRKGYKRRTFLFKVAIDQYSGQEKRVILTFDDITELLAAQRKAAWSDVARRIAHEIKNPLTPIQLSAERLKRKYLPQIADDTDTFSKCTETIIRQVGDIGRMVDEFSAFARMPDPAMKDELLSKEIREAVILLSHAHDDVKINVNISPSAKQCIVEMDTQQVRQVITNLIQNSIDSINAALATNPGNNAEIDILISMRGDDEVFVAVTDSGIGLPEDEDPSNLTEPYVTHKVKGTGLGLAIVKKIIEDHNGQLIIGGNEWLKEIDEWNDLGGATVVFILPVKSGNNSKGGDTVNNE